MSNSEFIEKVLRIFTKTDCRDDLYWYIDEDDELKFAINCSDVFWWGTADMEDLTEDNFHIFEWAVDELNKRSDTKGYPYNAGYLFCAKVRGMRPQGAYYKYLKPYEIDLFNECGPSREIDFANPYTEDHQYEYGK